MRVDSYLTPEASAQAELRERGSVFLAQVRPARDEAEVKAALAEISRHHHDATHHCWASRLGAEPARERAADAGEPRGTAGEPILRALRGAGFSDCLCVVTRWFGGTKLGKGGLVRAYAAAARAAVAVTPVLARSPAVELEIAAPYETVGAVKRLLQPPAVELVAESYGERALLRLRVWTARESALRAALASLASGIEVVDRGEVGR